MTQSGRRLQKTVSLPLAALSLLLAVLLHGCGDDAVPPAPQTGAPALTGPGITIALLPERNVFEQKKRYQPLEAYLSRTLEMPVSFKLLDNYQVIFSELLEHRVDGAFFGSMNGAISQLRGAVEVLARPVELDGSSAYCGYLFTKEGSGITSDPKSWKGKRMAFVNKITTAGYIYPLAVLRTAGIEEDPERYFSRTAYTGSHDAAILSVFNGESDLGACKNTVYDEYVRLHPEIGRTMLLIGRSALVPSNGLGVRPDMPADRKQRVKEALLGMHATEDGQRALRQFQAQRFVETAFRDYDPVLQMAKEAGIDLAAWPLRDIH